MAARTVTFTQPLHGGHYPTDKAAGAIYTFSDGSKRLNLGLGWDGKTSGVFAISFPPTEEGGENSPFYGSTIPSSMRVAVILVPHEDGKGCDLIGTRLTTDATKPPVVVFQKSYTYAPVAVVTPPVE